MISLLLAVTLGAAVSYGVYVVVKLFIYDSLGLLLTVHETPYGRVSFVITILFIVVGFVISLGLFTLKDVFRKLIVVISILDLSFNAFDYLVHRLDIHSDDGSPFVLAVDLLATVLLIWFFSTARIRKQFQTATTS